MFSNHSKLSIVALAFLAILGVACAPAPTPTSVPPATAPTQASPQTATRAAPTAAPTAAPAATIASSASEFMTPEGYWMQGKADAKVLFVDSSDFA